MRLPRWAPRPTSFERDVRVLCPCAVGGCEANPFGRDAMGRTATIAHACPIFMHVPPGMRLALLLRLRSSFPPLLSSRLGAFRLLPRMRTSAQVLGQLSINSMALPPVLQFGSQALKDKVWP